MKKTSNKYKKLKSPFVTFGDTLIIDFKIKDAQFSEKQIKWIDKDNLKPLYESQFYKTYKTLNPSLSGKKLKKAFDTFLRKYFAMHMEYISTKHLLDSSVLGVRYLLISEWLDNILTKTVPANWQMICDSLQSDDYLHLTHLKYLEEINATDDEYESFFAQEDDDIDEADAIF